MLAALFDLGGTAALRAVAERWTSTWLENANRLDPDEAFLALRLSARSAGAVTPEFVEKHLAEKLAKKRPFAEFFPLVATLGASTDAKALIATLDGYLQNKLEARTFSWLAYGASLQPHTRRAMARWALQNFPALARRVPRHDELTFLVSFSCDEAELAEWKKLFADQTTPKNTPGLEGALDQARHCASFRQKELPAVSSWLSRRSATRAP